MKSLSITATLTASLFFASFGTSCDERSYPQDIIGRWEDTGDYYGWKDRFEIENDLKGQGQFWLYYDENNDDVVWSNYDLDADGDGDTWVIDAESEEAPKYDFEMECTRNGDQLECACSGGFCGDYLWTFEPD